MISRVIVRYLHISSSCWASEKSQLAALRKKTGYTFSNCKKALELYGNDLAQAESWLNKQAQALGWSKATKLEGRKTTQGLVAVAVENNDAVLVEVNCETDFVARNNVFQEMAERAAKACLAYAQRQQQKEMPVTQINLSSEELRQLPSSDNKSLADHLALIIGSLGENATLRRAICVKAGKDIQLSQYAHPMGTENNNVLIGRLAGIVALKQREDKDVDVQQLGKDLCKHVVGMAPKRIGSLSDEPSKIVEDEICLIHQEYLIDSTATVSEILEENGVEVVDFKRFECGESLSTIIEQPLSTVETCQ